MLAKLHSIRPAAWQLFTALIILAIASATVRSTGIIAPKLFSYAIQPAIALAILGFTFYLTHGQNDRVRRRSDRAFLVGSVFAVWFVLYFLSGFITTYSHNSLVPGPMNIIINIWSYGVVAFCIEYARHGLMVLTGRRQFIWFGTLIALTLAIQQMNFGLIPQTHGLLGFVKLGVSDFLPSIVSSFLLTYLAVAGGLPSMLVYRLGLVAATILPPIIPKYDWYLQGMSLLLLAIGVYIAVDRSQQSREAPVHHRHPKRAYDIMTFIVMSCLALFMAGFFSYEPATILSNSMKPVFSRGAIVIVQKTSDPMDIKVGDIVQYKRISKMITHRVIAIDAASDGSGKRVFTTKGDNNPSNDQPVAASQLIGIIRAQIPYIGYPTVWLREASR